MAYTRSTTISYAPSTPPVTVDRAIWDEFYKIQQALVDLDRPTALAITSSKLIPIQATTVWTRLFDTAPVYEYALPTDQFDNTTGVWTVPQEGLYNFTITLEIPAFPNAGNRLYEATLRTTGHPANGDPDKVIFSKAGGPDEASLRFTADIIRPLSRNDQIWFDIDLTEEAFTGSVTVFSVLNITRIGGWK